MWSSLVLVVVVFFFVFFFFFFFQAEDGIRDDLVTGVQTCALPISASLQARDRRRRKRGPVAQHPVREADPAKRGGRPVPGPDLSALYRCSPPVRRSGTGCTCSWQGR